MSFRKEKYLSLTSSIENFDRLNGLNLVFEEKSIEDIKNLFLEILYNKVHGFCFSMYEEEQKPGDIISENQVRRRLEIISKYSSWVRSFSCIEGNEHVPKVAKELGMKTLVGAWLGNDKKKNDKEIEALIELAQKGLVDIAAVGNEVLYRKDLEEHELLSYIYKVKEALPNIPVGYVDAYYEFSQRPSLVEASDIILCNCYPFWEGCHHEYSMVYMKQMYYQAMQAANGKKVIITETGWPCQGQSLKSAIPSYENALKYFINSQLWAMDDDIEIFYFSSFDESWKVGPEGDVGAHWGIWDKNEKLKFT